MIKPLKGRGDILTGSQRAVCGLRLYFKTLFQGSGSTINCDDWG